MTGLNEFLHVFGNITISDVIVLIMAVVFLVLAYKKFSNYLFKRHDEDQKKDKQIQECLEAMSKCSGYRQQSIDGQKELEKKIQELSDMMKEYAKRVEDIENAAQKREVNKLRDLLLQNYKYYTDKIKNPLQSWTKMESEAFWDLFSDYESMGGNGYMHTEVCPKMQLLTVIDMSEMDAISELMQSRQ